MKFQSAMLCCQAKGTFQWCVMFNTTNRVVRKTDGVYVCNRQCSDN